MSGIYLHIPFCKQACTYCNFHFSTSLKMKDDMLQAILAELDMQRDYLQGTHVNTIYLGGGTPSLLSANDINRIFDFIVEHYPIGELKECTLEANPDDLSNAYLHALRDTPINRLSVGVQSFRDADLQYMNRAHNAQQSDYAIKAAQDAGFSNMSIDLIYGTPGLTDADWLHNLAQLKALQIPHFSSYALTVEEGTALHHAIRAKKTKPVDAAQAAGQFQILTEQAASMGYEHYEISNLALPGMYAVHNTAYWQGQPYLGIGPSAHSFNGKSRSWNIANNALYMKGLLQDKQRNFEEETLTPIQHLNEYIMTSLRTMWGLDLQKVTNDWGSEYATQLRKSSEQFIERNRMQYKDNKLTLTTEGRLFADSIAADMFVE